MNILNHTLMLEFPEIKKRIKQIPKTSKVIDVGCGIRPFHDIECEQHICLEPHDEYIEILESWLPQDRKVIIHKGKADYLEKFEKEDTTVLLLDVIEHMTKAEGLKVLKISEAFTHAIIFTPYGFKEQDGGNPDAWGLKGGYWQEHRSGWEPEDFPNWTVFSMGHSILATR